MSEFVLKIMEDGNLHEQHYISMLQVEEVTALDPSVGFQDTLKLMKEGKPLIYQGWIEMSSEGVIYRGRPDLLEKMPGSSVFGDWVYVPADIKSSSKAKTLHKQQLAFYCRILASIQGFSPSSAAVINGNRERLEVEIDKRTLKKMQQDISDIEEILRGGTKPAPHISNSAKESPWYSECLKEAIERDDLSLIYKMRKDSARALRKAGIGTVRQMAELDIDSLPKIPGASKDALQRAKMQAQALVEKRPIFIGRCNPIPQTGLSLYFDIEGDPWLGAEYLFGFWVVGDPDGEFAKIGKGSFSKQDPGKYFLYFLAESPDREKTMWADFMEWLKILPDAYAAYHYANYEQAAIAKLSSEYGASKELARFQSNLIDLKKNVDNSIVFPLYSYSIKDIAKSPFVDFKWRHAKAGGGQSIFWYESWLETGDRGILQDIIDYNEDDVRAAEHLHLWLNSAAEQSAAANSMTSRR